MAGAAGGGGGGPPPGGPPAGADAGGALGGVPLGAAAGVPCREAASASLLLRLLGCFPLAAVPFVAVFFAAALFFTPDAGFPEAAVLVLADPAAVFLGAIMKNGNEEAKL